MHAPAAAGEFEFVILLVQYAGARGHPLNVARPDDTGVACVVMVRHVPFPADRDCLEASVRMRSDAALRPWRRRKS
jgi:hypothetical protein